MPHAWKYQDELHESGDAPMYYKCANCGVQTSVSFPWIPPSPDKPVRWKLGEYGTKAESLTCEEIVLKKVYRA